MGTVASTNAGIANLLQTLTSTGSPLASSTLSSTLQSALQNASPADVVKLSDAALQLQETDAIFGVSDTSNASSLFSALESSAAGSSSSSSGTSSTANQLAAAQSDLQAEQTAALFGTSTDSATSNSLFDVVG